MNKENPQPIARTEGKAGAMKSSNKVFNKSYFELSLILESGIPDKLLLSLYYFVA